MMETLSPEYLEPTSPDEIWHSLQAKAKANTVPNTDLAVPEVSTGVIDLLPPTISASFGNSLGEDLIRVSVENTAAHSELLVDDERKPWVFYILRSQDKKDDDFDILVPSPTNIYDRIAATPEQYQQALSYLQPRVASPKNSIEEPIS